MAFAPDGVLRPADQTGMVRLWNRRAESRWAEAILWHVACGRFSPDRPLYSAGRDNKVAEWHATSGSLQRVFDCRAQTPHHIVLIQTGAG